MNCDSKEIRKSLKKIDKYIHDLERKNKQLTLKLKPHVAKKSKSKSFKVSKKPKMSKFQYTKKYF